MCPVDGTQDQDQDVMGLARGRTLAEYAPELLSLSNWQSLGDKSVREPPVLGATVLYFGARGNWQHIVPAAGEATDSVTVR
ncbi:unnamed protein product [Clonostachys rosea]|uniref:Uncharacterized protein n=1 Tax=Bionectria ochroleuca TaxID=29856 RepID=A0ABY6TR02_BIOOC|nr:unnamed protein product [Clonostachys rosea]